MNPRSKTAHQQRIEAFMRKAGQEVPEHPTPPSPAACKRRAKLILEEALETITQGLGVRVHLSVEVGDAEVLVDLDPSNVSQYLSLIPQAGRVDLAELADGCADLSVATIGTLSAAGIADEPILVAVDEGNLAKLEHICSHCGHKTEQPRQMGGPDDHKWMSREDSSFVACPKCLGVYQTGYCNEDGKWIKPLWRAPDIIGLLQAQRPLSETGAMDFEEWCAAVRGAQDKPLWFVESGTGLICYLVTDEGDDRCVMRPAGRPQEAQENRFHGAYHHHGGRPGNWFPTVAAAQAFGTT